MTLDEIERRRKRMLHAREKYFSAQGSLDRAEKEYADEQAEKAGITYRQTKVMVEGHGPFIVMGYAWPQYYQLAKVRKDGTLSKAENYTYSARLSDMTIIEDEAQ